LSPRCAIKPAKVMRVHAPRSMRATQIMVGTPTKRGKPQPRGARAQGVPENVHDVCFQKRCRAPNNTVKYDGKTNPNIWIEDYCLACRAGGADDDLFIIQFIPIYLVDKLSAWLDHLRRNMIDRWENLKEIFTDNFQGTYVRSSNPWDLKCCRQKPDESLRDYIWQFSRKCHKLPKIVDADCHTRF
jgi:hypothetical protein